MHNGSIADFQLIKRKLQSCLSEELFLHPSGYTGTSFFFLSFSFSLDVRFPYPPDIPRLDVDDVLM